MHSVKVMADSDHRDAGPEWALLLEKCICQRIIVSEFRDFSKIMMRRHPISGKELIRIVLDARLASNIMWDPLIPLYVEALQRLGYVSVPEILKPLLSYSTLYDDSYPVSKTGSDGKGVKRKKKASTLMTDNKIIQNAMTAITLGRGPKSTRGAIDILNVIATWISMLLAWNPSGDGPLSEQPGDRKRFGKALSAYIPLCSEYSIPLRNRLESIQKDFNLYPNDASKRLEESMMGDVSVAALQFESNVVDVPVISSRAGLYIYINALGHHVAMVEELVTAAFDVLSNGMYRNESSKTMFLFRAFLVNKLPPFLAYMSASSMEPIPMELCITRALSRVDPNTFPSFSETFSMQGNSVLSDVRQEFLFSCALHKLIPESSIERLLGENPMQTLPVGGQFMKHNLIAQMNNNPERAEQLLSGIESMEGNAGAIVDAITEVMHNLCARKETMTLKNICNSLSRRPQALDIMLLFKSPVFILQPLCSLLDAWKWDEEPGESQPVYDEFGSILLLVLAFKYKYNLTPLDLGINSPYSFTLRLLESGASSRRLEDLTENQNQNLGAWITALFVAEGISDESMSSCSPQEFYLLVATLFSQSLSACEAGKLEFETLKGGFESQLYFEKQSTLVMALTWLGNHIWESESDLTTSLKILHGLVKPASISGEAQEIHSTVLYITSGALEATLKDTRARHPSRTDIKPILDVLEPYHSFRRTGASQSTELDIWRANPAGGGLVTSIRNTFSSLVLWSTDPEISMTPPNYTHRQLLAGLGHVGSERVLQGLIDELKLQTETGSGDLAFDIATTLICAPQAETFTTEQALYRHMAGDKSTVPLSTTLTLRDALGLLRESLPKLIETDPHRAELIVRLHRRVEALCSIPQMPAGEVDVGNIMDNINLEAVSGTAEQQQQQHGAESSNQGIMAAPGDTPGNLDAMLDAAASAAVAGSSGTGGAETAMAAGLLESGLDSGGGVGSGTGMNDVFSMMDMGNPEFIDLDMEGMF
ncbi:mediator complex subunit [Emydomyces testavorans]|uniref:Mediator of RNA polymerase II transcription subunit 5 n=1 Tax=Emydomyces testavorans TaxID=2070801 RepID=A0AAF0IGB1_9EURO|nr:mediator complex subunit [Emydomyces testavorans]